MPRQTINIGTAPNDGTGDPLRTAFDKTNDNFLEVYADGGGVITVTDPTTSTDAPLNDALQNIFDSGGGVPTLQEVTTEGNETTNIVKFVIDTDNYIEVDTVNKTINFYKDGEPTIVINENGCTVVDNDPINPKSLDITPFQISGNTAGTNYTLIDGTLQLQTTLGTLVLTPEKITVNGVDYPLPTGVSSPLATLDDITGGGYTVVSSNQTAVNDTNYTVVANATFTDPSPTEGKGYVVYVRNGTATIGGTSYAVGSLVFRVFHSGGWSTREYKSNLTASDIPSGVDAVKIADGSVSNTEFQRLDGVTSNIQTQLNNRVGFYFKNTAQTVVNSTTSETIIYIEEVLGNTIANDTILFFKSRNFRSPRVGTCIYRLYINTVNNLSGSPVQIARLDSAANIGLNPMEKSFLIKDNILSGMQFNISVNNDFVGANVNQGTTTYNINTTYYWILTAQPNTSTDSSNHQFSILERI